MPFIISQFYILLYNRLYNIEITMSAELVFPGTTINIAGVDTLKQGLFCSIWPNLTTPLPYKKKPVLDPAIAINGTRHNLNLPFEFVEMGNGIDQAVLKVGLLDAADILLANTRDVSLFPKVREVMSNGVKQLRPGRTSWVIKATPFPFAVTENATHYFVEPSDLPPQVWYGKRKGNVLIPSEDQPIMKVALAKDKPGKRSYMKLSSKTDGHFHYEFEYDQENGLRFALLGLVPVY